MTTSNIVLPLMRLGEIVLATGRYDAMTAWYRQVLGVDPSLEHAGDAAQPQSGPPKPTRLCFFRLHTEHPYQDVVAIFEMPGIREAPGVGPGLHHMQLRNASLSVLSERFRRLREIGVVPYRSMDHGPGTSLYYRDPDHNTVELAASNFTTAEDFAACLDSDAYKRNPAGKAIDPDSMLLR